MVINIEEGLRILEKYSGSIPVIYQKDIRFVDKLTKHEVRFFQGTTFDFDHYEVLLRNGINKIEVVFSELLFAKLVSLFPQTYRLPFATKNFIDFDKYMSAIDDANRLSKRKRSVISATEITNKGIIIIGYGEDITFEKWNRIKGGVDRKTEISFYSSERGVLLVTFMKATDSNYLQKFFMHSEAVALFVEKMKNEGFVLSPDFYADTDVYTATSEEESFSKYVETNVRLVVIVDSNITEDYKNLIVKLRTYDRFVRINAITNLSPANELEVLKAIKKSYLTDNFL
jgi:hypothetical protein